MSAVAQNPPTTCRSGSTLPRNLVLTLALVAAVPTAGLGCASGARCVTVTPFKSATDGSRDCASGTRCITVPQSEPDPSPFLVGESLEPGSYSVVGNTDQYGLERPRDGWVYVLVEDWVLRLDLDSRVVLEDVTGEMPYWFR